MVGATGVVGAKMMEALEQQPFPVTACIPVASARSAGKTIPFGGRSLVVRTPEEALAMRPQLALFSAGGETSLKYAPLFAKQGCIVIDNSSAWRKDPNVPLVVPEVNTHHIGPDHRIIANPNCSTIQLVVVLKPLHDAFGIKRVVVATYQSVSGSGLAGLQQLHGERAGEDVARCYPHQIDLNVIPQGGDFLPDGTTTEEAKLVFETRKILNAPTMAVTATVVRVPVLYGHGEAVNIEFNQPVTPDQIRQTLMKAPGVVVTDDPEKHQYPMPIHVAGRPEVFVGRIRRDAALEQAADLWIVADNLLKGAATNAMQIAQWLVDQKMIQA